MSLLLTEADVKAILTMPLALELVEESFRRLADGTAVSHPRQRLRLGGGGRLDAKVAAGGEGSYALHGRFGFHRRISWAEDLDGVPERRAVSGPALQRTLWRSIGTDRGELSRPGTNRGGQRRGYSG